MLQLGDYAEDYADVNFKFVSNANDGTPTTLAGSPVLKVYKSNEDGTEINTGLTLSVDFDGVTGLNNVKIDLNAAAFYAVGEDYSVIITTGTVDGTSVVGYVVAQFSIENRFDNGVGALNNIAPSDIVSSGQALDTTLGVLNNVDTVDQRVTANTDQIEGSDATDQIRDACWSETSSELSGKPAQGATFRAKFEWVWSLLSNQKTQNATTATLFKNDASTPMSTSTVSTDGTTVVFGEWAE